MPRPRYRIRFAAEVQSQIQAQREARQAPKGPVTVPQDTLLLVRTSEPVNSKSATDGQPVQFMVIQSINIGGVIAIPRGAIVHGEVTEVKQGRRSERPSRVGAQAHLAGSGRARTTLSTPISSR